MNISCTYFYTNRSKSVGNEGLIRLTHVSLEFLAHIFTKIFKTERQHVEIFYIKFHSYRSRNEESTDRNLYNPFRKFITTTDSVFTTPPLPPPHFVLQRIHMRNSMKRLQIIYSFILDTNGRREGRADVVKKILFLRRKEWLKILDC